MLGDGVQVRTPDDRYKATGSGSGRHRWSAPDGMMTLKYGWLGGLERQSLAITINGQAPRMSVIRRLDNRFIKPERNSYHVTLAKGFSVSYQRRAIYPAGEHQARGLRRSGSIAVSFVHQVLHE